MVEIPPDSLTRIPLKRHGLLVVFDRPTSPGNLGSLIRSGDALGVDGLIVTGHATDVYDPKAVRASRGSLFAVPTVRAESPADVVSWLRERSDGPFTIVGTSETGTHELWEHDFAHPTAVVVGNETSGMSSFWSQQCDAVVRIPMTGSASSLNATVAASITLYEVARQRQHAGLTGVG